MIKDSVFVLSMQCLVDAGFDGSFNDLRDDIQEANGIADGAYDINGVPVMTIYGISKDDLADLLSDYGVDSPEDCLKAAAVPDDDTNAVDFDHDASGHSIKSEDDEEEYPHPEDDELLVVDDDDEDDEDDDDFEDEEEDEDDEPEEGDDVVEFNPDDLEDICGEVCDAIDAAEDTVEDAAKKTGCHCFDDIHDDIDDIEDKLHHCCDDDDTEYSFDDDDDSSDDEEDEVDDDVHYMEPDDDDDIDYSFIDSANESLGTRNVSEKLANQIIDKAIDHALFERVTNHIHSDLITEQMNEKNNPWSNTCLDAKPVWRYSNGAVSRIMNETKKDYRKNYTDWKHISGNSDEKNKLAKKLVNESRIIKVLSKELETRKKNTKPALFEGEDDGETATLTAITFKVKNADDFIKTLTDNGIPESALEKVGGDDEGSDEAPQQPAPQQPAPEAAPQQSQQTQNPFESKQEHGHALFEDENPFDNDSEPDNPFGEADEAEDTEGHSAEIVKLTDTSYAARVQKILQDVYGYSREDFEDKIGGTIEGDDNSDNAGSENEETQPSENKTDDDFGESSISPQDVFGDL